MKLTILQAGPCIGTTPVSSTADSVPYARVKIQGIRYFCCVQTSTPPPRASRKFCGKANVLARMALTALIVLRRKSAFCAHAPSSPSKEQEEKNPILVEKTLRLRLSCYPHRNGRIGESEAETHAHFPTAAHGGRRKGRKSRVPAQFWPKTKLSTDKQEKGRGKEDKREQPLEESSDNQQQQN